MQKAIRTDKWLLKPNPQQRQWLKNTTALYRAYTRALIGVVWTHWPQIAAAPSQCFAIERLVHATAKNPVPVYRYFDQQFYKFPSYLRRAAIEAAAGQVSSFCSRYGRWQSGQRSRRTALPPKRTGSNALNPVLYRGQNIKFSTDHATVAVKVWNGTDWIWCIIPVASKRNRHEVPSNKALSPTLLTDGCKIQLSIPFEVPFVTRPATSRVCAIDLGINTTATASIVANDGTVTDRKFFHRSADIDRRDKGLAAIRRKAGKTAKLSRGFCKGLYRKARNRNLDMARKIAGEIIRFASDNDAPVIVFERLKHYRPTGGRKRSGLKQKFHGWLHRLLVERVTMTAEELGIRIVLVNPRNTSKYAYDGSGLLKRDAKNRTRATFRNGKRYNADLNASYNIGAVYWHQQLTGRKRREDRSGKSSRPSPRTPVTLSSLWTVEREAATTAALAV